MSDNLGNRVVRAIIEKHDVLSTHQQCCCEPSHGGAHNCSNCDDAILDELLAPLAEVVDALWHLSNTEDERDEDAALSESNRVLAKLKELADAK